MYMDRARFGVSMIRHILFAGLCLVPAVGWAQPVTGPYVSLGGGVNVQQNEIVAPSPFPRFPANINYKFDVGAAGQASIGWGLGNGLRLDVEGDFIVDHVRGVSNTATPSRAGGTEQKYGGFLNVIYDLDLGLPVFPYIGVGAGGQVESLHAVNFSAYGAVPLTPPPGYEDRNRQAEEGAFAYQGIAGFAAPLSILPGLSLTAEYRFVGLLDPYAAFPRSFLRSVATPNGDGGVTRTTVAVEANRKFGNNYNHAVMLGIRYALFQPALPPPAQQAAATALLPVPEPARTYLVFFDWDRADLTARARQIVAEAAQASTHVAATRIDVNGYTDLSGTAAYNQRLSVRRAQSVEAELVRDGVSRVLISIIGHGESNPLVQTAKGVREPQNRRVEIVLH